MMKKLISILLAVLLLASLGAMAFADDYSETYDEMGMTLNYPEEYMFNTRGVLEPYPQGRMEDGVYFMSFSYLAFPYDEYFALLEKDTDQITEEEIQTIRNAQGTVLYVTAIDGNRGSAELIDILGLKDECTEENFTEITKVEDITFYQFDIPEETEAYLSKIEPEYAEEFNKLHDGLTDVLKNGEYSIPIIPGEEHIGQILKFETTDVEGNPVNSEDIFSEHELTMINCWTTWCGPCKGELKELGEMNRRLAEKNVAVIGICLDADEELDTCKALLKENNVDYLTLLPFADIDDVINIPCYPTSYFVDRDGKILSLPFLGAPADMSSYEETIDALLSKDTAEMEKAGAVQGSFQMSGQKTIEANDEDVYRVIVSDSDGDLVPGVKVQFCSDVSCMMGTTDENGAAGFEAEEGQTYTVHILKVPEGYEKTSEEFETLDTYSDVYVVLQKAG